MLRGQLKSQKKQSKAQQQQHQTTLHTTKSKRTKTTAVQKQQRRHITTTPTPLFPSPILSHKKTRSILKTSMSAFSTEATKTEEEPVVAAAEKKLSHEAGFDSTIAKIKSILSKNQDEATEILREQHKNVSGFEQRQWDVKDTLTVLPHFLELLQPDSAFVKLASHRVANLRAQLKQGEEQRYNDAKAEATDMDAFNESEVLRKIQLGENSIDMIPVADLLRLQMQIMFSATQFVHLNYQNYCKINFGLDQNGALLFSTILDHLETVPQLTFYRMHYQQALLNMSSAIINKPHVQMMDIMSSITPDAVQTAFLKRFAFSRSQAFKEALKDAFTRNNVLADTTMLPLSDPTNVTKSELISAISLQAFTGISSQVGIRGDAIGHFLFETEMAMGIRFPREPKHILNIKTQYNSSTIARMPQNPQIAADYARIASETQLSEQRIKVLEDEVADVAEREERMSQERNDSVAFIGDVEELPVHFPEDLWTVPVAREQRAQFFKRFPQAHALWGVYNQLINTATQMDNDMATIEQLETHNEILTKAKGKDLTQAEEAQIDEKIELNTHRITLIQDNIEPRRQMLEAFTEEYEIKAEPWRAVLAQINQEEGGEEKKEEAKGPE